MYRIMYDNYTDWDFNVGPTHILDKNYNFLPIYLGYNSEVELASVYVSDKSYIMINHTKPYVFIHSVDDEPDFDGLTQDIKEVIAEILYEIIENGEDMNRQHLHIFKKNEEDN